VGGIVFEHGVQDEGSDLAGYDLVAVVEGQKFLQERVTLAFLHVDTDDTGDQARQRVTDCRGALVEGAIEEMLAGLLALVLRGLLPVLGNKSESLNGGELTDTGIVVSERNLDQKQQRLGLGVVVLLQVGGDELDLLSVGWTKVSDCSRTVCRMI
jgi:hypothetical protein